MRLAHLTDPHLTTLAHARPGALANKRVLGYLSWRHKRRHRHVRDVLDAVAADIRAANPDHVCLTGDLTHIGLPEEFREAAEWLPALGDPGDVLVVPGNHDAYIATDHTATFDLWRPWLGLAPAGSGPEADWPVIRRIGNVVLVGINTAVPSAPFLATGRVGGEQLERLQERLSGLPADLFRVALIHHSPLPDAEKRRKCLTDAAPVLEALENQDIHLVLHGHGHLDVWRPCGDYVVSAPPSASQLAPGVPGRMAGWHQFDIERADDAWTLTRTARIYNPASASLEAVAEETLRLG